VNNRLKELRKKHLHLTQSEFGKKIGLTDVAISRYEKGERNITQQVFVSICREFNVNEEWLRTGKGEMFNKANKENEISKWVDSVLKDRPNNFKKRLLTVLSTLRENEWIFLEEKAEELISLKQEKILSSKNAPDEISATEEEIPTEYKNMSTEELLNQANMIENLLEKRQTEKSLTSLPQKNNYGKMA